MIEMRKTLGVLAIVAAAAFTVPAHAQSSVARDSGVVAPPAEPFGFRMGTPINRLQALGATAVAEAPGIYEVRRAPNPHAEFESYLLVASRTHGLCKVSGVGRDFTASAYGSEVRRHFESLQEALETKYGQPQVFDFVREGSIWNEPRDFMMGLLRGERRLSAFWDGTEYGNLPSNLTSIALEAKANGSDQGYLRLGYEFSNFGPCRAEITRASTDAL